MAKGRRPSPRIDYNSGAELIRWFQEAVKSPHSTNCQLIHEKKRIDPTPSEIRAACLEIQAGWDEVTERGRRSYYSSQEDVSAKYQDRGRKVTTESSHSKDTFRIKNFMFGR